MKLHTLLLSILLFFCQLSLNANECTASIFTTAYLTGAGMFVCFGALRTLLYLMDNQPIINENSVLIPSSSEELQVIDSKIMNMPTSLFNKQNLKVHLLCWGASCVTISTAFGAFFSLLC